MYFYACNRKAGELLFLDSFLITLILTQNGEAFIIKDNEAIHVLTQPVLPAGLASVTWDTKALSQETDGCKAGILRLP